MRKTRLFTSSLVVIFMMLFSAINPIIVYADGGTSTDPTTEEPGSGEVIEEETPSDESGEGNTESGEEETALDESSGEVTEEDAPSDESGEGDTESGEEVVSDDESFTVPEILEQAPEDTQLVIINNDGEPEPMATEAAADILAEGDPIWCPAGQAPTPGANGCTASYTTFADLLAALTADANSGAPVYTGSGIIYVEDSYNGNDDNQILFDGSTLTNISGSGSTLTVQGGWNGDEGANFDIATDITGTSLSDVSIAFVGWGGDIVINDFDIANTTDNAGFGLYIDTDGDVELDNVSVNGTSTNSEGFGDGAEIHNTGNVQITNSEFNNNNSNGLLVASEGNISLDNVSASSNSLTGAVLDSCLYENSSQLCASTGSISITNGSIFSLNGFDGLVTDSGGTTTLNTITVTANGLYGAILTGSDADGTGDIDIQNGNFSFNAYGTGLDILSDSNVTLATSMVEGNGTGAVIDTYNGTGSIDISDTSFITNGWTGLHAESGGDISLTTVIASDNGTNGAYLIADGAITVTDSEFNNNVQFNYPTDPGLYAQANGAISLTNVIANNNTYGAGVVLVSKETGEITVASGIFNDNGTFGIQAKNYDGGIALTDIEQANGNGQKGAYLTATGAGTITVESTNPATLTSTYNGNGSYGIYAQSADGDIVISGIEASYNGTKGVYLTSYGQGSVFVNDSLFIENGSYGIYIKANEANISLDNVSVTGDDGVVEANENLTDIGAFLFTENGGNIFVNSSTFNLNTETGLLIVATGTVDLTDVTVDENGVNGIEIYTPQTYNCLCPGEDILSIVVNMNSGVLTNNGEYGLVVQPSPEGILNIDLAATTFGGNGLGEYLLDLSNPEDCPECACGECCDEPKDPEEPKEYNFVEVPFEGSEPIEQDCENTLGTIIQLPDGTFIKVACPFDGYSTLEGVTEEDIPGEIGAGTTFVSGVNVDLMDAEGNFILNSDGTITLYFKIPEDSRGRGYSILFWDTTLNDGEGGWVQLPIFEFGTTFPLHPDNPEDGMLITSGVQEENGFITITVNFSGTFIMVSQ